MTGEQGKDRGAASIKLLITRPILLHLLFGTTLRYMAAVVLVKAPPVTAEVHESPLRVLRSPLLSFLLPQLLFSWDTAFITDVDGVVFVAHSTQVCLIVGVLLAVLRVVVVIWQVVFVVGISVLVGLLKQLVVY